MKKNLILILVVLVLGTLVLILPSKNKEKKENPENQSLQLLSIREPELKKLTLYSNPKTIIIEKKEKGYTLTPSHYLAGNSEFMNLIAQINTIEGHPVSYTPKDPEKTIIEAETIHGTLTLKIVGKREIGTPAYYIKNQNHTLIIEASRIDPILNTIEDNLRNHVLTDYTSKDIPEFKINQRRYYQKGEGKWFVEGLNPSETDPNKVFTVFATVSNIRIKNFTHSTNKSQYSLTKPAHVVTLKFNDGKTKSFSFSKVKNSFYCQQDNDPEIYEINEFDWKYFEKDLKSFKFDKQELQQSIPQDQDEDSEEEEEQPEK